MSVETTLDMDELRELIADVLDVEAEAITEDVDFVRDLDVDSLLALELAVTLERHYKIKVESRDIAEVRTMTDVAALLGRKLQSLEPPSLEPPGGKLPSRKLPSRA